MFFQLIVNHVTKSPSHQVTIVSGHQTTVTAVLICLLTTFFSSAAVSPEKFSSAAPGLHSPQLEVSYSSLPSESAALSKKIRSLKDLGFGGLVLTSIPSGSNSWDHITGIAECCRKNSIKLGCEFFPQVDNPELLYRVVSTNRIVSAGQKGVEIDPSKSEGFITTFRMPVAYSNDLKRAYAANKGASSFEESYVEYSYKALPFKPLTINYLDKNNFESSVNKFLLNAQLRLGNNYGTVFNLVRFPSLDENDLVWADKLPKLFFDVASYDLKRNIPVLAWELPGAESFVKGSRERYQRAVKRLWRDNFAENVRPLVHEAGLNAAISVNQMLLPPEEYTEHFQFPLAAGATGAVQRTLNRRITGGARIYECSRLVGQLDRNTFSPAPVIDDLFADGVNTLLFSEDIVGFTGSSQFNSLVALCSYVNRCSYLLLNSEPAQGVLLCSETIPQTMNRFVFDSVTPRMLKAAEINKGRLVFTSGRGSSTVVFSDVQMKKNKALADNLKSSGVTVMPLSAVSKLTPDFSWKSTEANLSFSFVHRSGLSHDYFMVKNESNAAGMVDLTFKINKFSKVSRWQPQDGKIYAISKFHKSSPMHTTLSMPVRPGELFFVVFDH